MRTRFYLESLKRELGVDGSNIKRDLRKNGLKGVIGTGGGIL
jgi:hypothetical protein